MNPLTGAGLKHCLFWRLQRVEAANYQGVEESCRKVRQRCSRPGGQQVISQGLQIDELGGGSLVEGMGGKPGCCVRCQRIPTCTRARITRRWKRGKIRKQAISLNILPQSNGQAAEDGTIKFKIPNGTWTLTRTATAVL